MIIPPLHDLQRIGDTHFSFATQRNGKAERAVIKVLLQIPERLIAWRSIADDPGVGVASFEPRSTNTREVGLKLRAPSSTRPL